MSSDFFALPLEALAMFQSSIESRAKVVFIPVFWFSRDDHVSNPFFWLLPTPSSHRTREPEASRIDSPFVARNRAHGLLDSSNRLGQAMELWEMSRRRSGGTSKKLR